MKSKQCKDLFVCEAWDQSINTILFQPNAAGRKYQELYNKTWRTNIVQNVTSIVNVRAFLGDYELTLLYNGNVIHTENVTIDKGGATPTFHIKGQGMCVVVSELVPNTCVYAYFS